MSHFPRPQLPRPNLPQPAIPQPDIRVGAVDTPDFPSIDFDALSGLIPRLTALGIDVREGGDEIILTLAADVLFDFDQYSIRRGAESTLQELTPILQEIYPLGPIALHGHTDAKGTENYNLRLSRQRAKSVRNWLEDQTGFDPSRLTTFAHGEKQPIAPNTNVDGSDNPQGRQLNRRVEIHLPKLPR